MVIGFSQVQLFSIPVGAGYSSFGFSTLPPLTLPTNSQFICRAGNDYGTHTIGIYGMGSGKQMFEGITSNKTAINNYINTIK